MPHTELVERVAQRLSLPNHQPSPPVVAELLFQMGMEEQIVLQGHREYQYVCYQPSFFNSEQNLASRLNQLLGRPVQVDMPRVSTWIDRFTAATGMQLSEQQRQAVEMAASERVLILSGGPGTGIVSPPARLSLFGKQWGNLLRWLLPLVELQNV